MKNTKYLSIFVILLLASCGISSTEYIEFNAPKRAHNVAIEETANRVISQFRGFSIERTSNKSIVVYGVYRGFGIRLFIDDSKVAVIDGYRYSGGNGKRSSDEPRFAEFLSELEILLVSLWGGVDKEESKPVFIPFAIG